MINLIPNYLLTKELNSDYQLVTYCASAVILERLDHETKCHQLLPSQIQNSRNFMQNASISNSTHFLRLRLRFREIERYYTSAENAACLASFSCDNSMSHIGSILHRFIQRLMVFPPRSPGAPPSELALLAKVTPSQ